MRNEYMTFISSITGVACDDIMSKNHKRKVANARYLLMWALMSLCHITATRVGGLLHRHYSSVLAGNTAINRDYNYLPAEMKKAVDAIREYHNNKKTQCYERHQRESDQVV